MKKTFSFLLALALVLSLGLVAGAPVAASSTTWYVLEGGTGSQNGTSWDNAFANIQDGINAAGSGDIIQVAAGNYTEDLAIPAGKDGLELAGAGNTTTKIKGVQNVPAASWPLAAPNIEILSGGVMITGFTIASPDRVADYYTSGMVIGGSNVEIYANVFEVTEAGTTDEISQAIQTCLGADISGLNIHDNTFTALVSGSAAGYEGIYINESAVTAAVTVADNVFGGEIVRAITTECSDTVITGNTIITDLAPGLPGGYQGIWVGGWATGPVDSVLVDGNTVKGSTSSEGFLYGIFTGRSGLTLTDISVTKNTAQDNETGILVRSSAGGVLVNYNNILGNTACGLNNTAAAPLNALYNWWGHETGPDHDLNLGGQGNAVGENVDFSPWLFKPQEQFVSGAPCYAGSVVVADEATEVEAGSYAGGWNTFSTPITLDTSANTVGKLLALTADNGLFIERAQRFDLATQQWVHVIMGNVATAPDYQIKPGEGFFIQVRDAGSIPVLVQTTPASPPSRNLVAGWNLIGLSSLGQETVETALSGVDYSMVLSPKPPNAEAWSVPPGNAAGENLLLGEAYWVGMADAGILFGITTTPVADDMTWELNQ